MVVASMTIEEIYKEVMNDLESVQRKGHAQAIVFQNEMKRKNLDHEVRVVSYKTAQFNEWNIMLAIERDRIKKMYYLRTNDNVGTVAYVIQFFTESDEKFLIKMNTHFFKRYNERLHLGLTKPADVIKHFFKHNFDNDQGASEMLPNGQRLVQFVYGTGVGIGWQDDAKKVVHVKTFIANETLNKTQKSLTEFIKAHEDGEQFETVLDVKHLRNTI